MHLKDNTDRALKAWIGPDTWYTNHDYDKNHFYRFVDQHAREHGTYLDEGALIEEISECLRQSNRFTEHLGEVARERVYLASNILDFLKASGRTAAADAEEDERADLDL